MNYEDDGLRVENAIVLTGPRAFPQAVARVKHQGLRGISIRIDWDDAESKCDLSLLTTVPKLEYLAFSPDVAESRLDNFESIYDLTSLVELGIHHFRTLELTRFPQLTTLFVCDAAGLRGLETLGALRELQIWGLRTADLSAWKKLQALQKLVIIQANAKVAALSGLEVLAALRHLDFHHCRALTSLASLPPAISTLRALSCPRLIDFSFLRGNESIDFLYAMTFRSLDFLPSMTAIARVGFESVTDGDLSPILRTESLRSVFCANKKHHSHKREELQRALDGRS